MKDCIKQKDVQETARDQNNFSLRVEQSPNVKATPERNTQYEDAGRECAIYHCSSL